MRTCYLNQLISFDSRISGLTEGYQYQFRVKAVNLGSTGLWNYSPPSGPSNTMTAKTRYMKVTSTRQGHSFQSQLLQCVFKDPGMYDIEVKAGKTIRYDLWFSGEPEPDVSWERDGMNLSCDETGRVSIENFVKKGVYCEKNSVLTIVRANRREDSGQYRIRLTCSGGSGEATGRYQTWLKSLTSGGVNFRQCQRYRCSI